MAGRFAERTVLVTGGTSGLGADTAELFIQEGANVFVVDLEERDILKRLGTKAHFQKCDVSSPEDCENAVKSCVEKFGHLDVLFHNAARLHAPGSVVDHDIKVFQDVINTNLCGLFYLARVVIPQFRKQGGGTIVVTASIAGLRGDYGLNAYSTAKHGTVGLVKALALDHAEENIRVNCVCPGYMVTPMTAAFKDNEPVYNELMDRTIPMHRGADPKEIGRTVLFLASDDASYITGQAIVIDGGVLAHSGFPNFLKTMGPNAKPPESGLDNKPQHQKKRSISQKSPGLWQAIDE